MVCAENNAKQRQALNTFVLDSKSVVIKYFWLKATYFNFLQMKEMIFPHYVFYK